MKVVARGSTAFHSVRNFSGRLLDRTGAEEELISYKETYGYILKVTDVTLILLNFMPHPFLLSSVVLILAMLLSFFFQCFNSVLESSFDSQVTKGKEMSMEPLPQGLQEDLVSFLLQSA